MWERTDECAMAATSSHRFNSFNTSEATKHQYATVTKVVEQPFILYDKDDDKHINAIHNIVRRDIWEGFVVDTGAVTEDNARRTGRLARYDGTIGFHCRFCKNVPVAQRAQKSSVYPRSLERIYLAI